MFDNRIQLPPTPIDFGQVGTTGQDHDDYPAQFTQARSDWMRSYLIGLLASQSAINPPTQFRPGTLWFDLSTTPPVLKICSSDNDWVSLADVISLGPDQLGDQVTLAAVYDLIKTLIGYKPTASFGGVCNSAGGVLLIPIPATLQAAGGLDSRPLVWVNGKLLDPRQCSYVAGTAPVSIRITSPLLRGDVFWVMMVGILSDLFFTQDVVV